MQVQCMLAFLHCHGLQDTGPLNHGVTRRKDPSRFPSVLNIGMVIMVGLYAAFGLLGYLVFGEDVDVRLPCLHVCAGDFDTGGLGFRYP